MTGRVEVRKVQKPWGHETIWAHTDRYVGKILHINAGESLSVQYHERKDETVFLLRGELLYRVDTDGELRDVHLREGESFRIVPGTVHQMEAVTDCDVLEASTPELDDVVRLGATGRGGLDHAVGEVLLEELQRERLQGPGRGGDLGEDVDAVLVLLDHPLQAADLPLDPAQPLEVVVLGVDVAVLVLFHGTDHIPLPGMSSSGDV